MFSNTFTTESMMDLVAAETAAAATTARTVSRLCMFSSTVTMQLNIDLAAADSGKPSLDASTK
jgi:hypothetical protein